MFLDYGWLQVNEIAEKKLDKRDYCTVEKKKCGDYW
jgi:hypothetical protein